MKLTYKIKTKIFVFQKQTTVSFDVIDLKWFCTKYVKLKFLKFKKIIF